jgi:phosphatidylinositol alpha-1,6-mannosyltransferase
MPAVFFAAESLTAGKGGIAQLARLTARVLGEEQQAGRLAVEGLVLDNHRDAPHVGFGVRAACGSRLRFVLRTHAAAVTHSHFIYDFLGMARAHCRLPLLRRAFMVWLAGIEIWENAPPVRIRTARRATLPVAISEYTRERAEQAHGRLDRVRVCWLGTEADEPAPPRSGNTGPPTVLIVGRLLRDRDKGHRALIACWPRVVSAVGDARLLMVGTGPDLDFFRHEAASSSAAANIEVRGFVPPDKMPDVWKEASVFAMPSRGEGFGFVYVEAMRHGLPIIASIHDAAPEINLEGSTGYNVSLDRPHELSDRIIDLLRDPQHAAVLGSNAQKRWQTHFCYSAFKARFLPLVKDFLHMKA